MYYKSGQQEFNFKKFEIFPCELISMLLNFPELYTHIFVQGELMLKSNDP